MDSLVFTILLFYYILSLIKFKYFLILVCPYFCFCSFIKPPVRVFQDTLISISTIALETMLTLQLSNNAVPGSGKEILVMSGECRKRDGWNQCSIDSLQQNISFQDIYYISIQNFTFKKHCKEMKNMQSHFRLPNVP